MPLMKNGLPPFMKRVPLTVRLPGSSGAAGNVGPADVVAHAFNTRPPAATAAPCRISRRLGSRMRGLSHAVSRGSSACTGSVVTARSRDHEPGADCEKNGLDCVVVGGDELGWPGAGGRGGAGAGRRASARTARDHLRGL